MGTTTRREFLAQTSIAAAGACFLPALSHSAMNSQPSIKFPSQPRERIAVASYPFREFIAGSEHRSGNSAIELKDFAAHVAEKFNINKIEPWTGHFPSTDPKYLAEFRAAVEKAHSGVANIAVDGEHSPYSADRAEREKAITYSRKWIDVAVAIGSPSQVAGSRTGGVANRFAQKIHSSTPKRMTIVCQITVCEVSKVFGK